MPYASLFSSISSHLEAIIAAGGYPLLFVTVLFEGIPLVGTVVPGHVAIIAAGFFAKVGIFNIWWVLGISIVAALIGDYIGFALGRAYGMKLIDRLRRYFFIRDSHIEKATTLLHAHTGKAMIIGRFSPVTRALMPFLVGTGKTSPSRFAFFNIVGAIFWAGLSVGAGYLFGAGYHAAAGLFGKAVLGGIALSLFIVWGYHFVNARFHIFKKYELFMAIFSVLSLWALAKTIQDAVSAQSFLTSFDVAANLFMYQHATPALIAVATWVTNIGGTVVLSCIGTLLAIRYLLLHKWRSAAIMILGLGSVGIAIGIMKEFFMRARPENAVYLLVNDPSFPSGHAGVAAAFFVCIAYIFAPKIRSWIGRESFIVACVLAAIAVGLSRVVLNVHWASDVIAGWSLGIFCASSSILLVRYLSELAMKEDRR